MDETDPARARARIQQALGESSTDATIDMTPQALSIGAKVAGPVAEIAKDVGTTAYKAGKTVAGYPIDVVKNAVNWTPRSVAEVVTHPLITAKQYILNHPVMNSNATLRTIGNEAANYAKNIGGRVATGLVQGAVGPESMFAAPYQMSAYEQERIRENPQGPLTNQNPFTGNQVTVDTLQYNPYAQMIRGEAATQGQAGAMNTRSALANQQYGPGDSKPGFGGGFIRNMNFGGLTPQEQAILEQDRIDQAIRRKAAQRVLGPVAPGQ